MRISVYTTATTAIEREFTLLEGVKQALRFCDELVFVGEDSSDATLIWMRQLAMKEPRVKIYENPWEDHMGKSAFTIQKNVALSHCTGDWCILLDADEVYGDKLVKDARSYIELADNAKKVALDFRTLHFYADYKHTCFKDPINDYDWYKGKIYAIKNNLGIHHGNAAGDPDGFVDNNDEVISSAAVIFTNLMVFHYGHVRSPEVYLRKKNAIERGFHLDWKDLKEWKFTDVDNKKYFKIFKEKHPEVMEDRIKLSTPLKHEDVMAYYKKFLEEKWL